MLKSIQTAVLTDLYLVLKPKGQKPKKLKKVKGKLWMTLLIVLLFISVT
jgi:hypothetical protein